MKRRKPQRVARAPRPTATTRPCATVGAEQRAPAPLKHGTSGRYIGDRPADAARHHMSAPAEYESRLPRGVPERSIRCYTRTHGQASAIGRVEPKLRRLPLGSL